MNTLLKQIIAMVQFHPSKKIINIILICAFSVSSVVFLSCSPKQSGKSFNSTSNKRSSAKSSSTKSSSSKPKKETKNKDKCGEEDRCIDICEDIYYDTAGGSAFRDCQDLDEDTVHGIENIHELLLKHRENDLDSEDTEYFKEYLEITVDDWKAIIQDVDLTNKSDAQNIIEWLAENEDFAEVLANHEDGSDILNALLEKATVDAITGNNKFPRNVDGSDFNFITITSTDISNKLLSANSSTLSVRRYFLIESPSNSSIKKTVEMESKPNLQNQYKRFFKNTNGITNEVNNDIFTLSNKEDNPALFKLASNTLEGICEDLVDDSDDKEYCVNFVKCWSLEVVAFDDEYNDNFDTNSDNRNTKRCKRWRKGL